MKVSGKVLSLLSIATIPASTAFTPSVTHNTGFIVGHGSLLSLRSTVSPAPSVAEQQEAFQRSLLAAQIANKKVKDVIPNIPLDGAAIVAKKDVPVTDPSPPAPAPVATSPCERNYGRVPFANLDKLYDLVVIGGGPAGVAGAIKAAQLGRRAIIIDRPKFDADVLPNSNLDLFFGGPTGLFSKALRDSAKNINVAAMIAQGMDSDVIWKQITNDIVKLAMRNSEGQCRTLARYQIDYLQGSARLLGEDDEAHLAALEKFADDLDRPEDGLRSVTVSNCGVLDENGNLMGDTSEVVVTGTKVLVCTGSKSTRLRGIPFDQSHRVFESDTINLLGFFPRSVTIAGLGIIGIEFANIFNALGVQDVKILVRGDIESSAKKLGMDMDVANELIRLLKKSGVKILEKTVVDEFTYVPPPGADDEYIQMKLSDGSVMETDLFFAATGRYPVGESAETGLASAGVDATSGKVDVCKETLATSSRNVYAAGDVIGPPALASTSMEQAQRAVSSMFCVSGIDSDAATVVRHDDPLSIGIWTIPEMGYYGMTKEQAELEGYSVVEGLVGFDQCLRGRVFAPDGLLKLVVDSKKGTVLGVHLIGKEAAEMVHYGMSLVKGGNTIFEILSTVYTAVTFHELFKEAALDANSKLDFGVEWQEIFNILSSECEVEMTEGYIREKFDAIDADGSGELDEEEMRALFESMGRPVSKRIIANMMRLSDMDGNGTIDFDEFKAIFDKISCPKPE